MFAHFSKQKPSSSTYQFHIKILWVMFLPTFFLFFLLVTFSGRTAKSFLVNVLSYVINKDLTKIKCDQGLNRFLDTQKTLPSELFLKLPFVTRMAHDTAHAR